LKGLFEEPFKNKQFTLDDQFDWVLHKKQIIEEKAQREVEQKRMLALQEANKGAKIDKR
jgi:hypothetical protein